MKEHKKDLIDGITIAGSIVIDNNKYINSYPKEGTLINILEIEKSFGGCVSNTATNLSLIDPKTNIHVAGVLGNDSDGIKAINFLKEYNLNVDQVLINENYHTAEVDVYINQVSNTRTFFANLAVNNEFGKQKIKCETKYLHLGYILLMPYLDEIIDGKPRVLNWLKEFHQQGIKISIDLVTDEGNRYKEVVIPILKYVNYLIINEIEASRITGINIFKEGKLQVDALKEAALKLKELGVIDLVIIHAPSLGLIYDGKKLEIIYSLNLPKEFIKSSVGAGDGFCAGALYGIMNNYNYKETLKVASTVAAGVLNSNTPQAKIKGLKNFLNLENQFGRKK